MPRRNTVNFLQVENGLRDAVAICQESPRDFTDSYREPLAQALEALEAAASRTDTTYLAWRAAIKQRLLAAKHLWIAFERIRDELGEYGVDPQPSGRYNYWEYEIIDQGASTLIRFLREIAARSGHDVEEAPITPRLPEGTLSRLRELLSYGVADWAITDADARTAFAVFQELDPEQVAVAVHKLDSADPLHVDRFIDNLPSSDRWGSDRRTFLRILDAREPDKNIEFARELLARDIFDWAVTDEEARLAFHIVKALPRELQTAFREAQEGEWWATMESNLHERDAHLLAHHTRPRQALPELEVFEAPEWISELDGLLRALRDALSLEDAKLEQYRQIAPRRRQAIYHAVRIMDEFNAVRADYA